MGESVIANIIVAVASLVGVVVGMVFSSFQNKNNQKYELAKIEQEHRLQQEAALMQERWECYGRVVSLIGDVHEALLDYEIKNRLNENNEDIFNTLNNLLKKVKSERSKINLCGSWLCIHYFNTLYNSLSLMAYNVTDLTAHLDFIHSVYGYFKSQARKEMKHRQEEDLKVFRLICKESGEISVDGWLMERPDGTVTLMVGTALFGIGDFFKRILEDLKCGEKRGEWKQIDKSAAYFLTENRQFKSIEDAVRFAANDDINCEVIAVDAD